MLETLQGFGRTAVRMMMGPYSAHRMQPNIENRFGGLPRDSVSERADRKTFKFIFRGIEMRQEGGVYHFVDGIGVELYDSWWGGKLAGKRSRENGREPAGKHVAHILRFKT